MIKLDFYFSNEHHHNCLFCKDELGKEYRIAISQADYKDPNPTTKICLSSNLFNDLPNVLLLKNLSLFIHGPDVKVPDAFLSYAKKFDENRPNSKMNLDRFLFQRWTPESFVYVYETTVEALECCTEDERYDLKYFYGLYDLHLNVLLGIRDKQGNIPEKVVKDFILPYSNVFVQHGRIFSYMLQKYLNIKLIYAIIDDKLDEYEYEKELKQTEKESQDKAQIIQATLIDQWQKQQMKD